MIFRKNSEILEQPGMAGWAVPIKKTGQKPCHIHHCGNGNCCMNFGGNPQHEVAGVLLVWLLPKFFAGCRVVVNRLFECGFGLRDRFAMETNSITDANYMTGKDMIFRVKFNYERSFVQ